MALGQVENSETSVVLEISEIFSTIFKSEFSILAMGQNRKLGSGKLGVIRLRFPRLPRIPSFRIETFHFFEITFFQYFQRAYFVHTVISIFYSNQSLWKFFFHSTNLYNDQNISMSHKLNLLWDFSIQKRLPSSKKLLKSYSKP